MIMSLDFYLQYTKCEHCGGKLRSSFDVFDGNITHNLGKMALAADIYEALWRPYKLHPEYKTELENDSDAEYDFEESHTMYARDVIKVLEGGLQKLKKSPDKYKKYNAPNGWGSYKYFVPFVEAISKACEENPDAEIYVSR